MVMKQKHLRKLVEMSYLHCWGTNGSYELRKEWHKMFKPIKKITGDFCYSLNKFIWDKDRVDDAIG